MRGKVDVVYLAGIIDRDALAGCIAWRDYVSEKLPEVCCLSPLRGKTDPTYWSGLTPGQVVCRDLNDIDDSDLVLVNLLPIEGATKVSMGTAMEMMYAWEHNKTIISIAEGDVALHPWVMHMSAVILPTVDAAIDQIKSYWRADYGSGTRPA